MGECGGNFPHPDETLHRDLFETYFADVWRFFINAVKIRPFGSEIHTHYDALFYRYCRLLNKEDALLTSEMVKKLIALENEAKEDEMSNSVVYDCDDVEVRVEDDDFFGDGNRMPIKPPRTSHARVIEAFTIMDATLKQLPLVITQRALKQELRIVASQFGFLHLVPYDEQQRAVIAMEEIKFQSEAIVRNSNSPYKGIHKSLVALVETETQWARKLFDFLHGEDDADGSLRKLMKQVGSKAVTELQSAQLHILEDFYVGLLQVLAALQQRLQACVNEHANQQHQVADLCDLFLHQDSATFDTYMVHLVVSAMFMDKFMLLVRTMLPKGSNSQGFGYFEGNLARAFQHLFKLNEAVVHIKNMVPNNEAHQDDIAKIERLHARVQYFVQMANDMKCFLEMRPVEKPLNDDELLKQMQEQPRLFQLRRLRMAFRSTCNLWMHVWDAGELDIRRVLDEVAKTVDIPNEASYIPK